MWDLITDHWVVFGYFWMTWTGFGVGVGRSRGLTGLGFILGLLLGPLGVALVFAMPPAAPKPVVEPFEAPLPPQPVRRTTDMDRAAGPNAPKSSVPSALDRAPPPTRKG